jgi:hypothetical protein
MPRKKATPPPPPVFAPPKTYGWLRSAIGRDVARVIARAAGMSTESLRQKPMLERAIPTETRMKIVRELESLATKLNNVARDLRAEDEP